MANWSAFRPGTIVWLSRGNGELLFEVLHEDDGRHLRLQGGTLRRDHLSGRRRADEDVIGPPGRPLMAVAEGAITQEQREGLIQQRRGQVPWEIESAMRDAVLHPAERGVHIIAGLASPVHAESRYVQIHPTVIRQWRYDLVANLALSAPPGTGVAYEALRVYTPAEWLLVERGTAAAGERATGRVGRPPAHGVSREIFAARRDTLIPLAASQLKEAEQIIRVWPKNGPPKPKPQTVSRHISQLWRQAPKTDKR